MKLFDGKSEGINDDLSEGINNLPDIYEDFLLGKPEGWFYIVLISSNLFLFYLFLP